MNRAKYNGPPSAIVEAPSPWSENYEWLGLKPCVCQLQYLNLIMSTVFEITKINWISNSARCGGERDANERCMSIDALEGNRKRRIEHPLDEHVQERRAYLNLSIIGTANKIRYWKTGQMSYKDTLSILIFFSLKIAFLKRVTSLSVPIFIYII